MKGKKVKMKIEIEVLSTDCVCSMLHELAEVIKGENLSGVLVKDDGDTMRWTNSSKQVEF